MKELLNRLQNPKTDFGKNLRDGMFSALAMGLVAFLQAIDTINFGDYNGLVTALVGFLVPTINRYSRK